MTTQTALDSIPTPRLGALVREHRRTAGLSRRELARRLEIPSSRLTAWENGERRPTRQDLVALAGALGTTVSRLVPVRRPLALAPEPRADQVQAFVRLVVTLRAAPAGSSPRFRLADLEQLAAALGTDGDDVEKRIARITSCSASEAKVLRRRLLRRRLLTPVAAGAFAAALLGAGAQASSAAIGGGAAPQATATATATASRLGPSPVGAATPASAAARRASHRTGPGTPRSTHAAATPEAKEAARLAAQAKRLRAAQAAARAARQQVATLAAELGGAQAENAALRAELTSLRAELASLRAAGSSSGA